MSKKVIEDLKSTLITTRALGIRAVITMRSKKYKPFMALVNNFNYKEEDARVTFERCEGTEFFPGDEGDKLEEYMTYIKNIKEVTKLHSDHIKNIEVHDLVKRLAGLQNDEKEPVGSESVSWQAHREAEKITDSLYVPILKVILDKDYFLKEDKSVFFILKCIANNLNDVKVIDYMVNFLSEREEEDKYDNETLYLLMSTIHDAEMMYNSGVDYFISLVDDEDEMIRNIAIKLLGKTINHKTEAEKGLIGVLENAYDDYGIRNAANSLYAIRSKNSIKALKKSLEDIEMEDAIISVNRTIENIENRE